MLLDRWNPAAETNAQVAAGSRTTGLPNFLEHLSVGSLQLFGFKGAQAPPKGNITSELGFLTIPPDFERYAVGASTQTSQLMPSGEKTTDYIHGPALLYQQAVQPGQGPSNAIQAQHFCQWSAAIGILGGKYACAKTIFVSDTAGPELIVFRFNGNMKFYSSDFDQQVELDMSKLFLTPILLPNQHIVYVAFNDDKFLADWQAVPRPIDLDAHLVAIDAPPIYSESHDIWVTFDASIR